MRVGVQYLVFYICENNTHEEEGVSTVWAIRRKKGHGHGHGDMKWTCRMRQIGTKRSQYS